MKYDKNNALLECALPGFAQKSGKVRDVFDLGETLLMVVTDRISAFDVILPSGVPDKGKVLNQLSLFWMDFLGMKNHLVTADVDEYPAELRPYKEDLRGRSMLVKKVKMLEVECIARGYLTGSGWKEYQKSGTVNGERLRAGYQNASKLDEVLFTPTTKAAIGDHDEAIDFKATAALVGDATAALLRDTTVSLYSRAAEYARARGIIIADTKFEFGLDDDGSLILADEVLTPDSSRFWPVDSYAVGANPPSLDKQYVRDWLDSIAFNHQPPGPELPDEVVSKTREIYLKAFRDLSGRDLARSF
ncbi:MAG: phosphoribosylaminoimidazolesuccinocarboxamide synthase [Kiritimatiellae bacterium]|nr:phosphoribosylaminoimidazolesuccinocarboxamide synthase [Kiritimatiellia bacterium]